MTALEAMARADAAWRERRPRVEKLAKPVIRHGETLRWSYNVPLRHGWLFGWRATQPEAFRACLSIIRERESRGWS